MQPLFGVKAEHGIIVKGKDKIKIDVTSNGSGSVSCQKTECFEEEKIFLGQD